MGKNLPFRLKLFNLRLSLHHHHFRFRPEQNQVQQVRLKELQYGLSET